MSKSHSWWQSGVIYQIYPRSFQDSNGDGVGDLPGIMERLPYLMDLGIDAIWISPIFPSPMADFGYDVSNYVDIDPVFGTLADFDALVAATHARGLKLILDYVPNHSSDQHPWFAESRSARTSPKRDWYIWRDPAPDGGPPNNWLSEFGGPAWTFDAPSGQYYFHAYLKEQPDLNWRNPQVEREMLGALKFWLDRGVDGFRVDAIHHLFVDASFRDNPPNPNWRPGMAPSRSLQRLHTTDQPEVQDAIQRMRALSDQYTGDRVLIGEAYLPFDRLMLYYGADGKGFQLPFNFHLMRCPWQADAIANLIETYEASLPTSGWPNWVLGNHDKPRLASRIGVRQTPIAAMLLLTLRGTPTLYQGDEIGMENVPIAPDQVQDPWEKNVPGLGLGRDPVRTPMQWDASPNAGFSSALPWLPLGPDWPSHNVASESSDPTSLLMLYRRLLDLRRRYQALAIGDYHAVGVAGDVLLFERRWEGERLLVALNFGDEDAPINAFPGHGPVLISTRRAAPELSSSLQILRANEGIIVDLSAT